MSLRQERELASMALISVVVFSMNNAHDKSPGKEKKRSTIQSLHWPCNFTNLLQRVGALLAVLRAKQQP